MWENLSGTMDDGSDDHATKRLHDQTTDDSFDKLSYRPLSIVSLLRKKRQRIRSNIVLLHTLAQLFAGTED